MQGEPISVALPFRNPLHVPLKLMHVALQYSVAPPQAGRQVRAAVGADWRADVVAEEVEVELGP